MADVKRESGFYWVRANGYSAPGIWEVMEYDMETDEWYQFGDSGPVPHNCIFEIDERRITRDPRDQ